MNELSPTVAKCLKRIKNILTCARNMALKSVNTEMVKCYWMVGREIVEEEQKGSVKADYGTRLLQHLSTRLTSDVGAGFSLTNLKLFRQFYLTYIDRNYQIGQTVSDQFEPNRILLNKIDLHHSASNASRSSPIQPELSWSHYCVLIRVTNDEARRFYEVEAAKSSWSVRELQRQVNSLAFERLARSRSEDGILALTERGHEVHTADDLVKDPYVLEFVGLPESEVWTENKLEAALIECLQRFLLELGRDLFFVARQKRISIDGDHFYIDLVFYHRILRCFLLIDLKLGKLNQRDIGQMLVYTGWYEEEEMCEGENPPIGLILCTDKNEAMVRYALSRTASQVFASRYQLHLPTEKELTRQLQRERRRIEDHIDAD